MEEELASSVDNNIFLDLAALVDLGQCAGSKAVAYWDRTPLVFEHDDTAWSCLLHTHPGSFSPVAIAPRPTLSLSSRRPEMSLRLVDILYRRLLLRPRGLRTRGEEVSGE